MAMPPVFLATNSGAPGGCGHAVSQSPGSHQEG